MIHVIVPIRNQRGIALLYLVIMFVLLGVLVSAGSRILGPLVAQRKAVDTNAALDRTVQTITAWGVRYGRLPVQGQYTGVFGGTVPVDAWGKPIVYAYYSGMAAAVTGGICGRAWTTGQEVAFLLISGGDDMTITSVPAIANGALSGLLPSEDQYRSVTMKELQAQAGCSGSTLGSLKILNNEVPNACKGIWYTATIYCEGGVTSSPYSFGFSGLPTGLANTGAVVSGTTSVAQGAYPVTVTVTDAAATSVQKKYVMNVMSSCN